MVDSDVPQKDAPPEGVGSRVVRLRALLALEGPVAKHWDEPAVEWRRLAAEMLGTFLLVVAATGGPIVNAVVPGSVPVAAQVIAPGIMVMATIYFMGTVSGAHLNPAVSVSFALRGNFPWTRVPGYVALQLIGAALASYTLRFLLGDDGNLGATVPLAGFGAARTAGIEALLTFGLVSVILGTASGARNVGTNAALAVGGYVALAGLWAAPITGASMNPARSFGPALVGDQWKSFWAYVLGPLLGGAAAVLVSWVLRGRPTAAGNEAAQGALHSRPT